jgi:histidyl-tRNA synthetase
MTDKKLSTEAYKGVRDFYPEDMFIQKHIFENMRKAVEKFGYVEYGASVLEPAELYTAKSGEEIVNEQTYTFTDRGDRKVTLRPEMTPTVARMVTAKRKALTFPLRWYSIPNLFRYEKPQRGRTREHWQLNVDIFGVEGIEADIEVISVANEVMKTFGAKESDFEIRINSRKLLQQALEGKLKSPDLYASAIKLLDSKDKMSKETFESEWQKISDQPYSLNLQANETINSIISALKQKNISNVVFYPTLVRGFAYYTDVVFEVYDTSPENRRALFGGGRYDDLASLFGDDKVPAVGFGAGDVTMRDFLETRNLLPTYTPSAVLYVAVQDENCRQDAEQLASTLRAQNVNVILDISQKKIGDQIKNADRQKIPFVTVIGAEEIKNNTFRVKKLIDGVEKILKIDEISVYLKEK